MKNAIEIFDTLDEKIDSGLASFQGSIRAAENFEKYIDFWVKFKPSVADKIMFCIYKGMTSPLVLRTKLEIAKGNLANYCKGLIRRGMIVQHTNGRTVEYELADKGEKHIKKFLEAMETKNVSL